VNLRTSFGMVNSRDGEIVRLRADISERVRGSCFHGVKYHKNDGVIYYIDFNMHVKNSLWPRGCCVRVSW
jgi:hypothetical protein